MFRIMESALDAIRNSNSAGGTENRLDELGAWYYQLVTHGYADEAEILFPYARCQIYELWILYPRIGSKAVEICRRMNPSYDEEFHKYFAWMRSEELIQWNTDRAREKNVYELMRLQMFDLAETYLSHHKLRDLTKWSTYAADHGFIYNALAYDFPCWHDGEAFVVATPEKIMRALGSKIKNYGKVCGYYIYGSREKIFKQEEIHAIARHIILGAELEPRKKSARSTLAEKKTRLE